MAVEIISNGSKWAGEEPDALADLLEALATHTLDPRFEEYGNFAKKVRAEDLLADRPDLVGLWHVHGNFYDVSHVFNLWGPFEDLSPIVDAIRANQRTEAYAIAKREQEESARARRERETAETERRRAARVAELRSLLHAAEGRSN